MRSILLVSISHVFEDLKGQVNALFVWLGLKFETRCQSDGPETKVTWPTMTSHNPFLSPRVFNSRFLRNLTVTHIWTGVSAYSLFLPKCFWFLWRSPQFWYDWHRCSLRQNICLLGRWSKNENMFPESQHRFDLTWSMKFGARQKKPKYVGPWFR